MEYYYYVYHPTMCSVCQPKKMTKKPQIKVLRRVMYGYSYRVSLPGVPMEQVLIVTHLCWSRRDRRWQLYSFQHNRLKGGSMPRHETPGPPSKIHLPRNTNTLSIEFRKKEMKTKQNMLRGRCSWRVLPGFGNL